jgi:cell division protein FtsB
MKKTDSISFELNIKLKKSDPEIQAFIETLQKRISQLRRENGKLEAENMMVNDRINALASEIKEFHEQKEWIRSLTKNGPVKLY